MSDFPVVAAALVFFDSGSIGEIAAFAMIIGSLLFMVAIFVVPLLLMLMEGHGPRSPYELFPR